MAEKRSVLNNLAYLLGQNDEKLAEALESARMAAAVQKYDGGSKRDLSCGKGSHRRNRAGGDPSPDPGGRHRWRSTSIWAW